MMHTFKKKVAKRTKPSTGEPSAEFQDYKLKLETVKKNLAVADKRMDEAKAHWLKHVMDQRSFSDAFAEGIADTASDTHAVAQEFSDGAGARYDHFVRETDPADAPYNKMHAQLKEYLAEIAQVEKMYPKLVEAKSEAGRYQSKVDSLEKASKTDDVRKERNLVKMDAERDHLRALQAEVTAAQKAVYGKSGVAQKMALVAYWQMNAEHVKVMEASLERTQEYSAANYDALASVDMASLDAAEPSPEVPRARPAAPPAPAAAAAARVPAVAC